MKVRAVSFCLVVVMFVLLAACDRKAEALKGVYATVYAILTQTASAAAKIPTNTSSSIQTTPSASQDTVDTPILTETPTNISSVQPVTPTLEAENYPTLQPTVQQTATPVIPTPRPPSIPTNPPVFTTNTSSIPTSTSPPPTSTPVIQPPQQGLVGLWQEDRSGATFQFNGDGSYRLADSYRGMQDDFIDDGQFTIQGSQVTLTGGNSSVSCKGLSGVYNLQITTASQRKFNLVQDVCFDRQSVVPGETWYWLPVKPGATPVATTAVEQPIVPVPLEGALASPDAKVSGLAWYNDSLIVLPQNPAFVGDGRSYLFVLPRADLVGYLNNSNAGPLIPQQILLDDTGISTELTDFQGYQAAAIIGDKIYLLVQANPGGGPRSYLIAGSIAAGLASITLDLGKIIEIPAPTASSSRLYRSLLVSDNTLLAIPELNGLGTNPNPVVQRFDANLNSLVTLPIAGIEYIVTDSAGPDANGRAWVLNKFAPGDPGALTGLDPLALLYGEGVTHQVFDYTERLVAYQVTSTGLNLAATPPIQLELSARGPRNWQGMTTLGSQGFLVVTSQVPGTILGYVPSP